MTDEGGPVDVVLVDPTLDEARAAVRHVAGHAVIHDLQLALTEVLANAHEHGRPPVEVVLHRSSGRLEVAVRDRGDGPREPVPSPPDTTSERGRGRWLAHRLVTVHERRVPSGFEVRLATALPGGRGPRELRG